MIIINRLYLNNDDGSVKTCSLCVIKNKQLGGGFIKGLNSYKFMWLFQARTWKFVDFYRVFFEEGL